MFLKRTENGWSCVRCASALISLPLHPLRCQGSSYLTRKIVRVAFFLFLFYFKPAIVGWIETIIPSTS
jgi:hypothetical protein